MYALRLNLIREFDKENKIIASICVAALPIGKSGILTNRKATTNDLMDGLRRKQLADFGANVQDEMIVVDRNIVKEYMRFECNAPCHTFCITKADARIVS